MAFDVNSLGGKLIDNQNIKKALESGGGGGGADFFMVNVTKTGSGESATYSADKTITQIVDAYNEGKSIYAIYSLSNTNKKVLPLVRLAIGTSSRVTFCNVESSAASGTSTVVVTPTINAITIDKNNVTLYRTFDMLTKEMEVRTIDSESTNYRYPTAKAVYDFVNSYGAVALRLIPDEQTQTVKLGKTYNELLALCKNGAYVFFYMPEGASSIEEANSFTCYSLAELYPADEYNPYNASFYTGDASYAVVRFTATSADEDMTMTNS